MSKIQTIIIIVFLKLIFLTSQQQAILISSSIGYYNYRQTSNVFTFYHQLKQYGFQDDDILLMVPENTGCCQKNPLYGTVSFMDGNYQNINHNVDIDYDFTHFTAQNIFDTIRGRFLSQDINKIQLPPSQKPQPLLIYITGHGGNSYFKIRQRQALIDENFKSLFKDLERSKRFTKILLLSDSCSAITPFETVDAENFTAFASSSFDQKSQSHGFDNLLNSPKSDDFTFYLMDYLQNNDPRYKPIYLKELFNYMSFDKLNVHAKIVGKGKKSLKTINEFLVKKDNPIQKKKLKLQSLLLRNKKSL